MPNNLALRMRPKNIDQVIGQKHLSVMENHSPYGGGQYAVINDSLRSSWYREDLNR